MEILFFLLKNIRNNGLEIFKHCLLHIAYADDFLNQKNVRIAEELNKYFANVGPNLASKIQNTSKTLEDFLFPVQKNIEYRNLTFKEFEKAFKSVKRNKVTRNDDIDSNVIIKVYDEISCSLFMIFHSSFFQSI